MSCTESMSYSWVRDGASRLVLRDVKVDTGKHPIRVEDVSASLKPKQDRDILPLVLEVYLSNGKF